MSRHNSSCIVLLVVLVLVHTYLHRSLLGMLKLRFLRKDSPRLLLLLLVAELMVLSVLTLLKDSVLSAVSVILAHVSRNTEDSEKQEGKKKRRLNFGNACGLLLSPAFRNMDLSITSTSTTTVIISTFCDYTWWADGGKTSP